MEKVSSPELIDKALVVFLNLRENYYPRHGFWVHSLSHFVSILWERRMLNWLKKLYKAAFEGGRELGDDNCLERLVYAFIELAEEEEDPSDYYLVPENLAWTRYRWPKEVMDRLNFSCF